MATETQRTSRTNQGAGSAGRMQVGPEFYRPSSAHPNFTVATGTVRFSTSVMGFVRRIVSLQALGVVRGAAHIMEIFMRHLLHARTRLHIRSVSNPRHVIPTVTPSPQFPDPVLLRARIWSITSQAAGPFRGGWQGMRWAKMAGFWWGGMTGGFHLVDDGGPRSGRGHLCLVFVSSTSIRLPVYLGIPIALAYQDRDVRGTGGRLLSQVGCPGNSMRMRRTSALLLAVAVACLVAESGALVTPQPGLACRAGMPRGAGGAGLALRRTGESAGAGMLAEEGAADIAGVTALRGGAGLAKKVGAKNIGLLTVLLSLLFVPYAMGTCHARLGPGNKIQRLGCGPSLAITNVFTLAGIALVLANSRSFDRHGRSKFKMRLTGSIVIGLGMFLIIAHAGPPPTFPQPSFVIAGPVRILKSCFRNPTLVRSVQHKPLSTPSVAFVSILHPPPC